MLFNISSAKASLVAALLPFCMLGNAQNIDDERAEWRLTRARLFGPPILDVNTKESRYSVHFAGAVADASLAEGYRCPSRSVFEPLGESERTAALERIVGEMSAIEYQHKLNLGSASDYYMTDVWPEYQRRFDQGLINKAEQRALVAHSESERDALTKLPLHEQDQQRLAELSEERYRAAGELAFYVQHYPSSEVETIVPMEGRGPDPDFAARLGERLAPFLKTCGAVREFRTLHYYATTPSVSRLSSGFEPNVLVFNFDMSKHRPVYKPKERGALGYSSQDPLQNPLLTQRGFKLAQQADLEQRAAENKRREQLAAEYRKAHATAAGRRPGIVYKLEDYWTQYDLVIFDPVRRVFDGDFAFVDSKWFRVYFHYFGDIYSNVCKKKVPSFVTYEIPVREYAGTDYHPDGSRTVKLVDTVTYIDIDARFTPQWNDWRGEAFINFFSRALQEVAYGDFDPLSYDLRELSKMLKEGSQALFTEAYYTGEFITGHGCDSAVVEQLRANFVRAANGLPSVQEAGILIANASAESDPLKQANAELSMRPALRPMPPPEVNVVPADVSVAVAETARSAPVAAAAPGTVTPAATAAPSAAPAPPAATQRRPTLAEAIEAARAEHRQAQIDAEEAFTAALMSASGNQVRRMQIIQAHAAAQQEQQQALNRKIAELRSTYGE